MRYTRRDMYRAVIITGLLCTVLFGLVSMPLNSWMTKKTLTEFVELQEDLTEAQATITQARTEIREYYIQVNNLPDKVKDYWMYHYSDPFMSLASGDYHAPPEISVVRMGNTKAMCESVVFDRANRIGYERIDSNKYRLTIFDRHGRKIKTITEAV